MVERERPRGILEQRREALAAQNEVEIYDVLIRSMPYVLDNIERWARMQPKVIIDEMLSEIPDTAQFIDESGLRAFAASQMAQGDVTSPLEAYLLSSLVADDASAYFLHGIEQSTGHPRSFAPAESIKCMRDAIRTKKFLQAIGRSVSEFERKRSDEIVVCDAGSGAIPILGMYAALSSPRVRVVCIENHPHSVGIARAALRAFKLEDRVQVISGEATTYTPHKKIDLLVSETMNAGLTSEGLQEILEHLKKFTAEDAHILPSKVENFVATIPQSKVMFAKKWAIIGDKVAIAEEVDWHNAGTYLPGMPLSAVSATVPMVGNEPHAVMLTSKVWLGDEVLDLYESHITAPVLVPQTSFVRNGKPRFFDTALGKSLQVSYAPGADTVDIDVKAV